MCDSEDRLNAFPIGQSFRGVRVMTRTMFAFAVLFAATALANAADLGIQAQPRVATWTGCYVGGNAGYGSATASSYYASPASSDIDPNGHFTTTTFIQNFSNKGFLGGVQLGCQQQIGMFLWGAEGDWASFNNQNSHAYSSGFDEGGGTAFSQTFNQTLSYSSLWSVRGRFGGILSDAYHLYATLGVGGATTKYAYTASISDGTPEAEYCHAEESRADLGDAGVSRI
jgi:outer membrane immunogenic protein